MAPPTKEVAELPRKSMAQLKREYRPTRQERAAQERIKVRVGLAHVCFGLASLGAHRRSTLIELHLGESTKTATWPLLRKVRRIRRLGGC